MSEENANSEPPSARDERREESDRNGDRTRERDLSSLEPETYYDEYGHEEWDRLEATLGGHLEFEGTTTCLERYLPDSGRVLDAGGGAGRYAVWLAERGYAVTLIDLSRRQCELARDKVREHGVADRVTVERADLRALPFDDGRFDAVCCTGGPLSHLTDEADRERALTELRRVARPRGPVFVSVMGRLAVLQNLVRSSKYAPGVPAMVESGTYDADFAREYLTRLEEPGFTACHFFRAAELEAVLESNGFTVEKLVGLEGIAANVGERQDLADLDSETVEAVTEAVRDLRTDPAVVDWSNHILAVARA